MKPKLDGLLKNINPGRMVTGDEAELLEELNKMRLKGDACHLVYLIKYCDAKRYR